MVPKIPKMVSSGGLLRRGLYAVYVISTSCLRCGASETYVDGNHDMDVWLELKG